VYLIQGFLFSRLCFVWFVHTFNHIKNLWYDMPSSGNNTPFKKLLLQRIQNAQKAKPNVNNANAKAKPNANKANAKSNANNANANAKSPRSVTKMQANYEKFAKSMVPPRFRNILLQRVQNDIHKASNSNKSSDMLLQVLRETNLEGYMVDNADALRGASSKFRNTVKKQVPTNNTNTGYKPSDRIRINDAVLRLSHRKYVFAAGIYSGIFHAMEYFFERVPDSFYEMGKVRAWVKGMRDKLDSRAKSRGVTSPLLITDWRHDLRRLSTNEVSAGLQRMNNLIVTKLSHFDRIEVDRLLGINVKVDGMTLPDYSLTEISSDLSSLIYIPDTLDGVSTLRRSRVNSNRIARSRFPRGAANLSGKLV